MVFECSSLQPEASSAPDIPYVFKILVLVKAGFHPFVVFVNAAIRDVTMYHQHKSNE